MPVEPTTGKERHNLDGTTNKVAYDLKLPFTRTRLASWGDPVRGDIVTCWSPAAGARLVKRVVGVPGDRLEMRDNRLVINGIEVDYAVPERNWAAIMGTDGQGLAFATENLPDHPHVVAAMPGRRIQRDFAPTTVPADCYFVMGDNRDNSADSRYFGFVERSAVTGRVEGLVWSVDYNKNYRPRWDRFLAPLI